MHLLAKYCPEVHGRLYLLLLQTSLQDFDLAHTISEVFSMDSKGKMPHGSLVNACCDWCPFILSKNNPSWSLMRKESCFNGSFLSLLTLALNKSVHHLQIYVQLSTVGCLSKTQT